MKYFEVEVPKGDSVCANSSCPCGGGRIAHGSGYLYISDKAVQFRGRCVTLEDFNAEIQMLIEDSGALVTILPMHEVNAVLLCRQSARILGIDLIVAAADAKYWWESGKVPLRATPTADQSG
jgi:hypothetical protein